MGRPKGGRGFLITGGAGFIGSNLAVYLKEREASCPVIAFDNLRRRGSVLNLPRLKKAGVKFVRGDIRSVRDLAKTGPFSVMIECSAEPSVLSGVVTDTPWSVIDNNLVGTVRCLDHAAKHQADVIFLSTSRVYPIEPLEALSYRRTRTRFEWTDRQKVRGASHRGIAEDFPLEGYRSFYGASKLCSEFLISEYRKYFGVRSVINRCGVVAGPWQMGKIDQGVAALWVARHFWKRRLDYIGYGGMGKQVRDLLHVKDLCELIHLELKQMKTLNGQTFNVGGGARVSASLLELTELCRRITGNRMRIGSVRRVRPADLRIYVSDCAKLKAHTGWEPKRGVEEIIGDIHDWIRLNSRILEPVLG